MPVRMPVLFAYASMAVHLMLISMGILILHSRKPSDLFQFVPFRFYLIFMFLCFSSVFSSVFIYYYLFIYLFLSINFSSPFLVMSIFLMKLCLDLTYNYPLVLT